MPICIIDFSAIELYSKKYFNLVTLNCAVTKSVSIKCNDDLKLAYQLERTSDKLYKSVIPQLIPGNLKLWGHFHITTDPM